MNPLNFRGGTPNRARNGNHPSLIFGKSLYLNFFVSSACLTKHKEKKDVTSQNFGMSE
jgi:hypothetical protein